MIALVWAVVGERDRIAEETVVAASPPTTTYQRWEAQ